MQTRLEKTFLQTPDGQLADKILRSCVHCGFCTATCPTYQLLGDELDGPRGRIYQIKQMLEGNPVSSKTLQHLDRCLTCRACETTCPSGVDYVHLLEIGKHEMAKKVRRPLQQQLLRKVLLWLLPHPQRFRPLLTLGQFFRPLLPAKLKKHIPHKVALEYLEPVQCQRKMLLLDGCVQPAMAPQINLSTRRVLQATGIETISFSGCCGAIEQHLDNETAALQRVKHNIDRLLAEFERGAEGIVITASGCGAMFKDYPHLLRHDPEYLQKARQVADKTFDLLEVVEIEKLAPLLKNQTMLPRIAVHTPCTLQHALKLPDKMENLLDQCGFDLARIREKHLCCGSAGTYSITQPVLSRQLQQRKLNALQGDQPDVIATANIGCLHHLGSDSAVPVKHWVEIVSTALSESNQV